MAFCCEPRPPRFFHDRGIQLLRLHQLANGTPDAHRDGPLRVKFTGHTISMLLTPRFEEKRIVAVRVPTRPNRFIFEPQIKPFRGKLLGFTNCASDREWHEPRRIRVCPLARERSCYCSLSRTLRRVPPFTRNLNAPRYRRFY